MRRILQSYKGGFEAAARLWVTAQITYLNDGFPRSRGLFTRMGSTTVLEVIGFLTPPCWWMKSTTNAGDPPNTSVKTLTTAGQIKKSKPTRILDHCQFEFPWNCTPALLTVVRIHSLAVCILYIFLYLYTYIVYIMCLDMYTANHSNDLSWPVMVLYYGTANKKKLWLNLVNFD